MLGRKIRLLKRLDQLIRLKATGNCYELGHKLEVSKDTIYRLLDTLKVDLHAPVVYNKTQRTYEYSRPGKLVLTFKFTPLNDDDLEDIEGGIGYKFSKNEPHSLLLRIGGTSFGAMVLPQNPGTGAIAY